MNVPHPVGVDYQSTRRRLCRRSRRGGYQPPATPDFSKYSVERHTPRREAPLAPPLGELLSEREAEGVHFVS